MLFLKPDTALSGPYPDPILVGKHWQDDQADFETELSVIIGKEAKNVSKEDALDYVLGSVPSSSLLDRTADCCLPATSAATT